MKGKVDIVKEDMTNGMKCHWLGKDEDWELTTGMIEREIALAGEFGGRV